MRVHHAWASSMKFKLRNCSPLHVSKHRGSGFFSKWLFATAGGRIQNCSHCVFIKSISSPEKSGYCQAAQRVEKDERCQSPHLYNPCFTFAVQASLPMIMF